MDKITLDRDAFKVFASDTRLDILKSLDARQKTVTELSRELDLNKATVFEHLEKLASVGLVLKLEDERKWVYYALTWKGRRILHPDTITIALMLSSAFAAIAVAAATLFVWWKGRVVPASPGSESPPTGGASSAGAAPKALAAPAAASPSPAETLAHDPNLLLAAALLLLLAGALAAVAAYVWRHRAAAKLASGVA